MVEQAAAPSMRADTVLPKIDELFVDHRQDWYLLLNPRGPTWCAVSKPIALVAELADGRRTLRDIAALLQPHFEGLTVQDVAGIAEELNQNGLFYQGERGQIRPFSNVSFNLTKTCNLSCSFCYYDSGPSVKRSPRELTAAEWIDLGCRIYAINPYTRFWVAGGEPLVRGDVFDILDGLAALKPSEIRLVTNGTLFRDEHIARAAAVPNLIVQVSIDSIVPEENEQTRGSGSLERSLAAVEALKAAGVHVLVSSTLTRINMESRDRLVGHMREREIRVRNSIFFVGGERSKTNAPEIGLTADDAWDLAMRNASTSLERDEVRRSSKPGNVKHSCGVGYGTLAINHDGTVSPCNHLTSADMTLGDVRVDPLEEILRRGAEAYSFVDVDKMPTSGCGGCHVRYICGGGCKASSLHAFGTMRRPPPDCGFLKRIHVEALWEDVLRKDYVPPSSSTVS